ncbi:MAG: benzoyl-CoA 2,3-epoxidase subunit BoxA [Roseiarcus sp.]|jgi:benzoyl-CoA 2,3-dioxygenase component A
MGQPIKQHLIDPEICIRCYTCEAACSVNAIEHDGVNVVVDVTKCNFCMDCIAPCPTGSIDNWRVVEAPYSLSDQYSWRELPAQVAFADAASEADAAIEAIDDDVVRLLAEAHGGAGGAAKAPPSASKPTINLYTLAKPAEATVQGNYRLTAAGADSDVRHIILDFGGQRFPALEGQSLGVVPPGLDADGKPHAPRLYSISSPRDGERPNFNNLALTVKREPRGLCSNYVCDLKKGDKVRVAGPFGATFLMPNDPKARLLMICTGTGSAPFRAFTMRRQRNGADPSASMTLVFGARTPDSLPYFGPLNKVPEAVLKKHLVFSRAEGRPKRYVQDELRDEHEAIGELLADADAYVYVCGLRAMERGVEEALADVCRMRGRDWSTLKSEMRAQGRYHVETY